MLCDEAREIVVKLSAPQREVVLSAEMLVDGRVLVPAYSVPDMLTRIYSVQRSALNRVGLAVREVLASEAAKSGGGHD